MLLLRLLQVLLTAGVLVFVVTQLIVPLWRDAPLFPSFRRRRTLRRKLREAEEALEAERIAQEIDEKRVQLEAMRARAVEKLARQLESDPLTPPPGGNKTPDRP